MMEVSERLKADIISIQNELKIAIQTHQILQTKLQTDKDNVQMKTQLAEIQKHIIVVGEKQKRLVEQLRKEMKEIEANSTNSTLTVKSVALSLGLNNNVVINNNNNNDLTLKCMPVRPCSASSTSSSATSEESEDSQRDREEVVAKCCNNVGSDTDQAAKIQFMSAIGLVTREVLAELQNKRVERKRRSTANHTQFVYAGWDVTKRKKCSYLSSTGVPAPPRRSLRVETPATTENMETLRIPGLPASLTIERIKAQVCVVCRKPGTQLGVCSSCSAEYHTSCAAQCPQCSTNAEVKTAVRKEKEAEKEHLLGRNNQLNRDKEDLQKSASELSAAIAAQEAKRKRLLQAEEATRKKIQTIKDFVSIIKTAPRPPT